MKGTFFFDPEDRIYKDHFPGNPVVPGSVIISAFLDAAEKAGVLGDQVVLSDFRFKKFGAPGTYTYRMELRPDHIVCQLFSDDPHDAKPFVTGKVAL